MIYMAHDYKQNQNFEADICVIGSGAGGAVVAYELAAAGHSVIIIEEGGYYSAKDYNGKPLKSMKRMWHGAGSTVSFGIPAISIPYGKCVGGTTAINSATCFRTPPDVVEQWNKELGLDIDYEKLEPYFDKVEKMINVTELSWDVLGNCAKIVKRGADALGLHCKPLKHNVKNCKGCGTCQFGCVEGAKQSMDISYIPSALHHGAQLLTHCRAEKIIRTGSKLYTIQCRVTNQENGAIVTCIIRANIVVLACGSMLTPLLLRKSGIHNKHIGKHLQIHPCSRVVALMDEEVYGWVGVSQGAYIDDFAHEGIMLEGIFVHPSILAASLPGVGTEFWELAQQFKNIAAFGVMVHDTGQGKVFGSLDMPLSLYSINKKDTETLKKGIAYCSEIFFAAGAKKIFIPVSHYPVLRSMDDVQKLKELNIKPHHIPEIFAFHPLGTCRMAGDSSLGVVNRFGKCFDADNIYIADGSVIPTSLGVNPQITIMTVATYIAEHIADELSSMKRKAYAMEKN